MRWALALIAAGGLLAVAVQAQSPKQHQPMRLESTAFRNQGAIPSRYTCEGANLSPPLAWHNLPEGTASLVLIVDDPDAPDPRAPKMTWVHWVVFNLPPMMGGLHEGVRKTPAGATQGLNDWNKASYGGPCPPKGRHRYIHKLYALNTRLSLGRAGKAEVEAAMAGHILAQAQLVGTYQKRKR